MADAPPKKRPMAVIDSDDEDAPETSKTSPPPSSSSSAAAAAAEPTQPKVASFFLPRKTKPKRSKLQDTAKPSVPDEPVAPEFKPSHTSSGTAAVADGSDTHAAESRDKVAKSIIRGTYHPLDSVSQWWGQGQPVPYRALCTVLKTIEGISSRLEMQSALCNLFRSIIALTPGDLLCTVYLCCNRLAPAYAGIELGIGDSILIKALSQATGRTPADIKAAARKAGDLGVVAEASRGKQSTLMRPKPLTVRKVLDTFREIAAITGNKSQDRKVSRIRSLLAAAGSKTGEAQFIIRGLQGKLRIGVSESTVLVSLAHAITITPPNNPAIPDEGGDSGEDGDQGDGDGDGDGDGEEEAEKEEGREAPTSAESLPPPSSSSATPCSVAEPVPPVAGGEAGTYARCLDTRSPKGRSRKEEIVAEELAAAVAMLKEVYAELPTYDDIIPRLLEGGVARARKLCSLTPGIPVAPMLAKPTKGVAEVLDRFETARFTCEYKYDGERAQVHSLPGTGKVHVFSRNSEETSNKYPDLATAIPSAAAANTASYILDGEVVAYDPETGALLPFQRLSTRARKDVDAKTVTVQVIYQAFDLLYLNGRSLLREPLVRRRELLREAFAEVPHKFQFAKGIDAGGEDGEGLETIQEELERAVADNCEGLMVKTLVENARYEPSKRSLRWLKLKKDYMDGLTDTFDLVPIGAWHGKGKRTGTFGAFLLACFNPETEEFESITKIGTGFNDEDLASLSAFFKEDERIVDCRPTTVRCNDDTRIRPEVWLKPCAVWEVKAADLSISPVHVAASGLVDATKGIALRFPRFERVRDDKGPEQATSSEQIADFYRNQPVVASSSSSSAAAGADDDDFFF